MFSNERTTGRHRVRSVAARGTALAHGSTISIVHRIKPQRRCNTTIMYGGPAGRICYAQAVLGVPFAQAVLGVPFAQAVLGVPFAGRYTPTRGDSFLMERGCALNPKQYDQPQIDAWPFAAKLKASSGSSQDECVYARVPGVVLPLHQRPSSVGFLPDPLGSSKERRRSSLSRTRRRVTPSSSRLRPSARCSASPS